MIAGKRYLGSNVDIWSCGVILFAMICGYLPFEDPNTANLYKKILNGEYTIPKFVSADSRDLITNILNTDPEKRFKISDIRKHPWFNQITVQKISGGIFIGLSQIPINMKILDLLVEYNFKKDYAIKCINANKHNHVTTSYYLLLKRYEQLGEVSEKDFEYFDDKKINQLTQQEKSKLAQSQLTPQIYSTLNQTMPVKKAGEDFTQSLMKPITQPQILTELGPSAGHHVHSVDEEMYGSKQVSPSPAPPAQMKEMMNKTVGLKPTEKAGAPFSLADQHSRGVPVAKPRIGGIGGLDGTQDKSRIQVCVETSQAERHAGMNVSYENSFNAIKKDIAKETVDKMRAKAAALGAAKEQSLIPIEEKPNKPKEKLIVKNMGGTTPT